MQAITKLRTITQINCNIEQAEQINKIINNKDPKTLQKAKNGTAETA